MIKATDLRVGNFVEYNGIHYAVWSIATDYLELDSEPADKHYDNIKTLSANPIPLTPEILEACGFEYISGDVSKWLHFDSLIRLIPSGDKDGQFFLGGFTGSKDICYIKYLHQLQNIFYFLVNGMELIYNPK